MLLEKILHNVLELAYQRDSLQIATFCEVTWKIAIWNNSSTVSPGILDTYYEKHCFNY